MNRHRLVLPRQCRPAGAAAGFTLVELLVAVTIGLVLTLVLTNVMIQQEAGRRAVTGGNDLTSNAAFSSYTLDRELRSAGSGFSDGWTNSVGCVLRASRGGAQILPRTAAFPAPFASLPTTVTLAPLLIHAGAGTGGSDVIAVAAGSAGLAETLLPVLPGSAISGQVRLPNTLGMRGGDLVMIMEATKGCMLQQVTAGFVGGATQPLTFAGTYAADVIDSVSLTTFAAANNAYLSVVGNVTGNRPRLQVLGVGANDTLFTYDMLRMDGLNIAQPLIEGVADMRALYGIADAAGKLVSWVAPTGTTYGVAALTNGTTAAQQTLRSIVAVRVGLVLRSDLVEKAAVTAGSLTLFADMPTALQYTYTVASGTERQRFRAVEFTVPLRNVQLTY